VCISKGAKDLAGRYSSVEVRMQAPAFVFSTSFLLFFFHATTFPRDFSPNLALTPSIFAPKLTSSEVCTSFQKHFWYHLVRKQGLLSFQSAAPRNRKQAHLSFPLADQTCQNSKKKVYLPSSLTIF